MGLANMQRRGEQLPTDTSGGRKNLPERAAIADPNGADLIRAALILFVFSEWHGAC